MNFSSIGGISVCDLPIRTLPNFRLIFRLSFRLLSISCHSCFVSFTMSSIKLSHTLWSPADTVKDVSESLGLNNLPDEVAKALAMDVEYRIHEVLDQALKFMRHSKRTTLTTQDISKGLKVLNCEPLYGYESSSLAPVNFKEALVGPGQTLYYIDDPEVDFEKLINQPLPAVPRLPSFTSHWLAIEGVQPAIPQNPSQGEIKSTPSAVRGSMAHHSPVAAVSYLKDKDVEVKPLVKHVLSKELQIYFDKIVAALVSTDPGSEHLKNAAITSLRSDSGLHQLIPYFIQFVAEKVTHNLKHIELLSTMLETIYALVENPTIFIAPYIHSLLPSVLTLLLAKKIGDTASNDHYAVRQFASALLKHIVEKYGDNYQTLKPKITRTLLKAFLDPTKPVSTLYGSILGFQALGGEIVRVVLLGNLKIWVTNLLDENKNISKEEQTLLINALIDALRLLKPVQTSDESEKVRYNLVAEPNEDGELLIRDEYIEKLNDRFGEELTEEILNKDDTVEIVNGIFFGDV